jgi:hypothetical protein
MDWRKPGNAYNIVRDWNKAQGYSDPSDEIVYIRRDIDIRRVSIQNSSERAIGVAITAYPPDGPLPKPQFMLRGGGVKNLGINTMGGPMQWVWMLDPTTKKMVGEPAPFRTDSNEFVLRDGINKWWVDAFHSAGFKG